VLVKHINQIDKFPIIILSSPRTGSNLLAELLSKKFPDLKLYLEPDKKDKTIMDSFTKYSNDSNQYILKLHLKYINNYPKNIAIKIRKHDAFLIKIQRKDIISQMTSLYIELIRDVWYYNANQLETYKEQSILIDMNMIKLAIYATKKSNTIIETSRIMYDLEIYYEDLINELSEELNVIPTPKPINYTEIYQIIKAEIEK
jgi:LPS sulfotransferase NodH